MTAIVPRILGTGYAVPINKRGNDDPIFDWLKTNNPAGSALFKGYEHRRVLAPEENLMTLMVPAALRALKAAAVTPDEIDLLIGYCSVSPYETPNELGRLHHQLGLPPRAWVLPVNNEFSNYNASLVLANSLMAAGLVEKALVVVAGDWTRHVDYHTPQAVSASDGAGAAVLGFSGDGSRFRIVDARTLTDSSWFGTMFMQADPSGQCPPVDPHPVLGSRATFHITAAGLDGFREFGITRAPEPALEVMKRHNLTGADITLVCHQASTTLLDAWRAVIKPAQLIETVEQFANLVFASIAVNLAWADAANAIKKDSLLLLGLGPEQHAHAVLLQRDPRPAEAGSDESGA